MKLIIKKKDNTKVKSKNRAETFQVEYKYLLTKLLYRKGSLSLLVESIFLYKNNLIDVLKTLNTITKDRFHIRQKLYETSIQRKNLYLKPFWSTKHFQLKPMTNRTKLPHMTKHVIC